MNVAFFYGNTFDTIRDLRHRNWFVHRETENRITEINTYRWWIRSSFIKHADRCMQNRSRDWNNVTKTNRAFYITILIVACFNFNFQYTDLGYVSSHSTSLETERWKESVNKMIQPNNNTAEKIQAIVR